MSVRESDCPGKVLSGKCLVWETSCPGNVCPRKVIVRETSVMLSEIRYPEKLYKGMLMYVLCVNTSSIVTQ